MSSRQNRRTRIALLTLLLLLSGTFIFSWLSPYLKATLLLLHATSEDPPQGLVRLTLAQIREEERQVTVGGETLRVRFYTPVEVDNPPPLTLIHGIHYLGIDEPRMRAFARAMAAAGVLVCTPEIKAFTSYRIQVSNIDEIAASAKYLSQLTGRHSVGVMGISFAGGLALLAAADPEYRQNFAFVIALGAHHDLNRLARYYAGDQISDPDGHPYHVPPHPYGARVFINIFLDELFDPPDLPIAQRSLLLYLNDKHKSARAEARHLPQPARDKMLRILDDKDPKTIGPILLSTIGDHNKELDRLSPSGKFASLRTPVYLIHGADDPVIPSTETRWLAKEIPEPQRKGALVSTVLRHAELNREPRVGEYLDLIGLIADILKHLYQIPQSKS